MWPQTQWHRRQITSRFACHWVVISVEREEDDDDDEDEEDDEDDMAEQRHRRDGQSMGSHPVERSADETKEME